MSQNSRRGGVLGGLLLTIVVVGVLVIVAMVSVGLFVAQNVRVTDRRGGETKIETPFGSMRVRENVKVNPELLGLPVYPGAVRDHDSRKVADFHLDIGNKHKQFAVAAAGYTTQDSIEQVTAFYRNKLPHWMISETDHGDFNGVRLELKEGGYKKMIAIFRDDGETHIGLASFGAPESN
jgi:hypothetical protein